MLESISAIDIESLKQLAGIAGGFASGVATLAALLGLKNRIQVFLARRRDAKQVWLIRRAADAEDRANRADDRAEWFRQAYAYLVVGKKCSLQEFNDMTVVQACAVMGKGLPDWTEGGWDRARLGTMYMPLDASRLKA